MAADILQVADVQKFQVDASEQGRSMDRHYHGQNYCFRRIHPRADAPSPVGQEILAVWLDGDIVVERGETEDR